MTKDQQFESFFDHIGLKHFRGKELTPYWSRIRNGARNSIPPESLWTNIIPAFVVLDAVRDIVQVPLSLLSTYRNPAYNAAIGGEPNSFHMRFMAIDFTSSELSARKLHRAVIDARGKIFTIGNSKFVFKGGVGLYPSSNFVHIDCRDYAANWTG